MAKKRMVFLVKASGEREEFSEEKYRASLQRARVSEERIDRVLEKIRPALFDGMTTKDLYRRTYQILRSLKRSSAGRYHLRRAVMELGPSGYPFEKFVAKLLEAQGYKTEVGIIVPGKCAQHEVDVAAQKNRKRILVECKFHNRPGLRSRIQTALYVKARYDDVKKYCDENPDCKEKFDDCWIVTNTKFSSNAISYGECAGLTIRAWGYPRNKGFESLIEKVGLHPVTCLTSITKRIARQLISNGVVLCRDVVHHKDLLRRFGLSERKINVIIEECGEICEGRE